MIHEGLLFARAHDLQDLVKRWTVSGRVWPPSLRNVKTLTPYAVESRYPG